MSVELLKSRTVVHGLGIAVHEDEHRSRLERPKQLGDRPVSLPELRLENVHLRIEPMDRPLEDWHKRAVSPTVSDK